MRVSRRRLLQSQIAAVAGFIAGCQGRSGDDGENTPRETADSTSTTPQPTTTSPARTTARTYLDEPVGVVVENDAGETRRVSVSVTRLSDDEQVFSGAATVEPGTDERVYETARIARYRVGAELDTGEAFTATWKVCTGYDESVVLVSEHDGETRVSIAQTHLDPATRGAGPDASDCELDE